MVVTFGPDGFSGHPDHVAVGAAVTAACYERRSSSPIRLFHCHRPQSRMLLRDRLAAWVVELTTRFEGTNDFVHAMSVFSRETSALGYAADFVNVEWFPSRTYLIEQGEAATTMYLILSGHVEIRREDEDGDVSVLTVLGAGQFVGEEGIATGRPRNAHVVAVDDVTTPDLPRRPRRSPSTSPGTRRSPARRGRCPSGDRIDARVRHVRRRLRLRRPQDPGDGRPPLAVPDRPRHVPRHVLQEMFGVEYFIQVLPERELDASLLDGWTASGVGSTS